MDDNDQLRKIILYGDVNLDIIDGSAVWLVSMARVLADTKSQVHVVLKTTPRRSLLLDSLQNLERVSLHFPPSEDGDRLSLTPQRACDYIARLDREIKAEIIIVRGRQVALSAVPYPRLSKKLWAYITDLPYPITEATSEDFQELEGLATSCKRLFVQTDEARSYLEANVPSAAGKTLLLTPMVPNEFFVDLETFSQDADRDEIRLVYAGKFAPDWRTLEICTIPEVASQVGARMTLSVIGDKIQSGGNEVWADAMQRALHEASGVVWHGGVTRDESMQHITQADFGIGWRAPVLDSSLELSTKALEYAAAGTPPVLNRTAQHEEIFGADYPLFISGDTAPEVVRAILAAKTDLNEIRAHAQNAVRYYSFGNSSKRLEAYFRRTETYGTANSVKHTILVAGHDLKFIGELAEYLESRSDFATIYDEWPELNRHDEEHSFKQLQKADVVFCEWAGHNAIWYSKRISAAQKLFIRLHGFEANAAWLSEIDIDNVNKVIVVSEHLKRQVLQRTGWDADKLVVIPNFVNVPDFERPKIAGHRFRLGLVGMVPFLKRPDRALDLIEKLVTVDERFTLHIRGRFPWEYPHVWKKELEQESYLSFFSRIGAAPHLQNHVAFEAFGSDMGSWLRKIGWVLSPSDRESFHLAPAEAMASGAVPLIWQREGAVDIFSDDFVVNGVDDAADRIISLTRSEHEYPEASRRAYSHALKFDAPKVFSEFARVLKTL